MTDKELQEKCKDVRFGFEIGFKSREHDDKQLSDWIEITTYMDTKRRFLNTKMGEITEKPFPQMDLETLKDSDNKLQSYWDDMVRLSNLYWEKWWRS